MKFQSLLLGLLPIDLIDIATAIVCLYLFLAGFCGRIFYRTYKASVARRVWALWLASFVAGATWPIGMRWYWRIARGDRRVILPSQSDLSKGVK